MSAKASVDAFSTPGHTDRRLIGGHWQQLFRADWELAHPCSSRVVNRIRDCRRSSGDSDFTDSTSAQGIKNRIWLIDEMDVHGRYVRVGCHQVVGEICVRIPAVLFLQNGPL